MISSVAATPCEEMVKDSEKTFNRLLLRRPPRRDKVRLCASGSSAVGKCIPRKEGKVSVLLGR